MRFEAIQFGWPGQAQVPLVADFTLSVSPGSVTTLVGASGSGKSTLLRLAAGLLRPSAGAIHGLPEDVAFVFQSPNLLPWRSVRDNVALPLQLRGAARADRNQQADAVLARVGLAEVAEQLPGALSGGMRMRVSLARALVTRPALMLMDEPFSALDALTRRQMHQEFLSLWAETGLTVLLVTHDLEEAVVLSDRVVVVAGRPLGIARDEAIDLPRPRGRHDAAVVARVAALEAALT